MEQSIAPSGINELFSKYLDTLTDVCKAGIQLAGKLDQHMHTREYTAYRNRQPVNTAAQGADDSLPSSDQPYFKDLMEFYSNILTKMAPLWFITFQRTDEGLATGNNVTSFDGIALKQCQVSEHPL